jgi:hypothetical protein
MMRRQVSTIARYTVLEAWRTRLFALVAIVLALVLGAGYFVQQIAITDTLRIQAAFSGALARVAMVFVVSLHVVNSMIREFNDKGLELVLSFELPRFHYILGRVIGFTVLAVAASAMAALPLVWLASASAALQWGVSLALELAVMVALSVFCVVTFTHVMPAVSFVAAFYIVARVIGALQLMSDTPLAGGGTLSHHLVALLVNALALILPPLDRFTETAWLVDALAPWTTLAALGWQACVYTALLTAAAMFDFYRRNL